MDLESRINVLETELRGLKSLVGQSNPQILYNKFLEAQFEPFRSAVARAYLTANQAINHGENTPVSGYTEVFDIGSNFASDKYTAPVTGYYHVDFGIAFFDPENKLITSVAYLTLNGTVICEGTLWRGPDCGSIWSRGSGIHYLVVGQYLQIVGYIYTSDESPAVMYAGDKYTFMSVHLISI